jgi:hypothetical protein
MEKGGIRMKTNRKYRPNQPEDLHSNGRVNRVAFATRIVNTENRPLSVKEAWSLVNKRDAKSIGLNQARFGAALSAAVRSGRIDKTRTQETPTKTVVSFHPLDMKPMGLDIPVPLYTRDTDGYVDLSNQVSDALVDDDDVFTFDDDDEANECWKCGSIVAMEDTVVEGTKSFCSSCAIPAPVKVAEKVIADIAGLPADGPTVSDFIPPHTKHTPVDEDVFNTLAEKHKREGFTIKHNKEAADSFDPDEFVKKMTEQRDAVVSTIQHHFTAEQLLDTLNNLNPDLHDDVLVAIYRALGKPVYIGLSHDFTKPQPRKTAHMAWAFINGNLVVKQ